MQKFYIIVCCACIFLSAQEENSNKRRVSFGIRFGGGIGLSTPSEEYKKLILDDDIDDPRGELPSDWYPCRLEWRDGSGSFDFAPFVSLQLGNFFAIQTEMLFTKYCYIGVDVVKGKLSNGDYIDENGDIVLTPLENGFRITGHALIFPILAKLTFCPSKFSIQTFVGPHFTLNVGKFELNEDGKVKPYVDDVGRYVEVRQPPVGLTAGANFGVKTKSGVLFLDARYFTDLGYCEWANGRLSFGRRARLSLTAGYEFRLASK
jgi:hypothetical protein